MRRLAGWAAKSVVAWGNMRCGRTPCSPFFVATRSPTERLMVSKLRFQVTTKED
jgi:hypothetical protein